MKRAPAFVFAVKTTDHLRVATGDVVAVVGERFSRWNSRGFAHDFIPFDDEAFAVDLFDYPFPAKEFHGSVRLIMNTHEIDESVGAVFG